MARHISFGLLLFAIVLNLSIPGVAGLSNGLMDISADGQRLVCSHRDSGTVTVVDLEQLAVMREIPVGHKPEGVSFLGETHRFAVAVYGDDLVRIYHADTGKELAATEVFDEPYGIVSTRKGDRLYVTLDYPGRLLELDGQTGAILHSLQVGQFVRGLAIAPKEDRLFITEYYTGIVKAIDLNSKKVVDQWQGTPEDNLARQIALHPKRAKAYVPHQRSVVTNPQGTGAIFPYISIIDTDPGPGKRRSRVQMDSFRGTYVVANPWELAISPDGSTLLVVFSGTNDLFACRVLEDNYRELEYRGLVRLGFNPRAVRYTPDGSRFFVYNALDFNVVAYDAKSLQPIKVISVCESPLDEETLLGKRLFYLATQPMVGRRWISCSSCHPDGEPDGRTWQQPEGLRNTQSLAGMAWTHPIHWSADRDEVQDFEHTIRGPLMQGRGLARGPIHDPLGRPNSGLSKELDALAVYSNSHGFPMSPYAKTGLSASAKRGKALFFSKSVGCAECHSGPFYTDSRPGAPKSFRLHDVGTGKDDPTEKMGPRYDTPTLLGIYRTAPYLHHGQAKTLRDVLTKYNSGDRHGKTSHLSEAEIEDLISFLKALPYEDPEPAAEKAGLTRIIK